MFFFMKVQCWHIILHIYHEKLWFRVKSLHTTLPNRAKVFFLQFLKLLRQTSLIRSSCRNLFFRNDPSGRDQSMLALSHYFGGVLIDSSVVYHQIYKCMDQLMTLWNLVPTHRMRDTTSRGRLHPPQEGLIPLEVGGAFHYKFD